MTTSYKLLPKERYLSGNVREKLIQAERVSILNPIFLHNVELLQDVQPDDIPLTDISISFSSIWIPLRYFEEFIYDVLSVRATVRYSDANSNWSIDVLGGQYSTANTSSFGLEWSGYGSRGSWRTYKLTATDLIELAMNFKTPTVRRKDYKYGKSSNDATLTTGAIDKQRRLQDAFADWLRADPERKAELESRYNKQFNSLRLPSYDGSHLKFPRMSDYWRNRMRGYQANSIYRGTLGNFGAFHEVGLGKTLVGQGICMERKRIDSRTKSALLVKKATLGDFAADFRKAYPFAKLLIATERDCNSGNRQLFMAKAAAGNWDCIVLTHEAFESLPLRPETIERHIEPMLERIRVALAEFGVVEGEASDKKRKPFSVKNLERVRNRLRAKLQQAIDKSNKRGSQGLFFEDLGINFICADEADVYINAPIVTKLTGVAGLSSAPSAMATDFEWKIEWLRQTHGTGRLCLMTGTFISNTMANLYVMQRFLQPEMLEERGIYCFDAWASMFGQVKTGAEVKADGTIGRKSRFSKFVNMPELLQLFFAVAEIIRFDDVKDENMVRPEPRYINVLAPMSPDQSDIMAELVERADCIRARDPQTFMGWDKYAKDYIEKFDNLLRVTTHGRWGSLDARILRPDVPDFKDSKVNRCVDNVLEIWNETAEKKSIQMIFLDMSTPGKGFNVYDDFKAKLIARGGVPESEIAFMQDYKTDEGKKLLFAQARVGLKRILIGSRSTMGVGVNVQHKLYAIHHLDCPWRPRDLEQAEGRGIRSGNENSEVLIYRYITQGIDGNCGFDSFMWQLIEAKWRFILQIMKGDMSIREIDEDASDNPTFSAAEVKALATGNMKIMRYTDVQAQLDTLVRLENSIIMDIDNLRNGRNNSIPWSRSCIRKSSEILTRQSIDFDTVRSSADGCTGDNFKIQVNQQDFTDRKEAGTEILGLAHHFLDAQDLYEQWSCIGYYGGFEVLMMASSEVRASTLLRGPSQATYEVRFVRDRAEAADRIESAYLKILEMEAKAQESVELNQEKIIQIELELARKQQQLGDVRSQVREFALEKADLEVELGLNEGDADASMLALCGEDSDD